MATIKAIEGRSVHQIQSGQVIVDLNSVVKELVENSLDAGASSIDVRFKNQGLECIEVQDNGKGIAPDDYETVALKHHTSKLSSYEDLTSLDTFGFRGEALSSLCALSKCHILTARLEDGPAGKRLDFEVSGRLKSTSVASAQKGTTVSVDEIFYNLPVRRKELEKNIKREYGKVLNLLQAYACISVGVRFSVSNQMVKGKKIAVFSTKPNTTTKENIVNVYGAKTLLALTKLDLHLGMEPSHGPSTQGARNWSTQATDKSTEVQVQGHISRPVFGEGRQAPDRQMFFVNSRPCQLPQVSKAINEVYKSFNVSQSPFIFANLVMDTNSYDVNVSPDKRTIMLHDQTALLESLKTALTELFERTDHTIPQSTLPNRKLPAYQPLSVARRDISGQSAADSTTAPSDVESSDEDIDEGAPAVKPVSQSANAATNETQPNLMQGWLGRDAEERKPLPAKRNSIAEVSKDKKNLVEHMQKQSDTEVSAETVEASSLVESQTCGVPEDSLSVEEEAVAGPKHTEDHVQIMETPPQDNVPDPMSTAYDDLFSQRPPHLPKCDRTFESTVVVAWENDEGAAEETSGSKESVSPPIDESVIPAISTSSQMNTPGPVQNAFDRMRPKRTLTQVAEITVGNTTTTTVLGGSPSYKKRRMYAPNNSQSIAKFGASPLLARGLRNFAAPGSQMEFDSSDPPSTVLRPASVAPSESGSEGEGAAEDSQVDEDDEVVANPVEVDQRSSDPLDELLPAPADDDELDEDYVDERERRIQEDERVACLIQEAEDAAARPSEENLKRASQVLRNGGNRKEATLQLIQTLGDSTADIKRQMTSWQGIAVPRERIDASAGAEYGVVKDELDENNAESKLSLTVTKADFERMTIVGQFNLGFVLAIRPSSSDDTQDELFIIDQHAADEKYNYERLQRTITLQSQRLVRPKLLELTAVEEEIILNNSEALNANGFEIETSSDPTDDDDQPVVRQHRLLTLPLSGTTTFSPSDLEELLHLLSEVPSGSSEIPRPKKVQRMLAMRACRSSIMVGKTLTKKQMSKVVTHMGEMDKPWNCPHGRPTMRHLAGLGAWSGWQEGDAVGSADESDESEAVQVQVGRRTDWAAWLAMQKRPND
ncbi:ATP-binding mismatch repair protein [Recurvomyces mirabilis]|nr:ATP-binding mismatch repair protein [Recurvomyces mirabilis]